MQRYFQKNWKKSEIWRYLENYGNFDFTWLMIVGFLECRKQQKLWVLYARTVQMIRGMRGEFLRWNILQSPLFLSTNLGWPRPLPIIDINNPWNYIMNGKVPKIKMMIEVINDSNESEKTTYSMALRSLKYWNLWLFNYLNTQKLTIKSVSPFCSMNIILCKIIIEYIVIYL